MVHGFVLTISSETYKKEPRPCVTHITAAQDPIFAKPADRAAIANTANRRGRKTLPNNLENN